MMQTGFLLRKKKVDNFIAENFISRFPWKVDHRIGRKVSDSVMCSAQNINYKMCLWELTGSNVTILSKMTASARWEGWSDCKRCEKDMKIWLLVVEIIGMEDCAVISHFLWNLSTTVCQMETGWIPNTFTFCSFGCQSTWKANYIFARSSKLLQNHILYFRYCKSIKVNRSIKVLCRFDCDRKLNQHILIICCCSECHKGLIIERI